MQEDWALTSLVFTPGFGQADTCKVALQQNAFYLIIKAVINVSGAKHTFLDGHRNPHFHHQQ